jgi:hypothetical protein
MWVGVDQRGGDCSYIIQDGPLENASFAKSHSHPIIITQLTS